VTHTVHKMHGGNMQSDSIIQVEYFDSYDYFCIRPYTNEVLNAIANYNVLAMSEPCWT
jgi:hypothetical protein